MLSLPSQSADRTLKEGWVHKKGAHVHKFRRRYMVLKANLSLTCYKSAERKVPTEVFDLSKRHKVEAHRSVKEKFYLMELANPKKSKKRTFKGKDAKDRDEWVVQIKYAIVTGAEMLKSSQDAPIKDLSQKQQSMRVPTSPPQFPTFESTQSIFSESGVGSMTGARGPMSASATYVYIAVKPSDFRNFRIRSVTVDRNPFLDDLDAGNHSSDNSSFFDLGGSAIGNGGADEADEKGQMTELNAFDIVDVDDDDDEDDLELKDDDIQRALENISKMTQNFATYMSAQSGDLPLAGIEDPIAEKRKLERMYVENELIETELRLMCSCCSDFWKIRTRASQRASGK